MIIDTPSASAKMATAEMYVEYKLFRRPKKNRRAVNSTNAVLLYRRLLLNMHLAYHGC